MTSDDQPLATATAIGRPNNIVLDSDGNLLLHDSWRHYDDYPRLKILCYADAGRCAGRTLDRIYHLAWGNWKGVRSYNRAPSDIFAAEPGQHPDPGTMVYHPPSDSLMWLGLTQHGASHGHWPILQQLR